MREQQVGVHANNRKWGEGTGLFMVHIVFGFFINFLCTCVKAIGSHFTETLYVRAA